MFSSLQVVIEGLPAQEPVEVDSGGLGHPGRAQKSSFRQPGRVYHLGKYVGARVEVQELEFRVCEKL